MPRFHAVAVLVVAATVAAGLPSCRTIAGGKGKPDASATSGGDAAEDLPGAPASAEEMAAMAQLDKLLPDELPTLGEEGIADELPGWDNAPAPGPEAVGTGGWMRSGADAIARAQAAEKPIVFWISDQRSGTDMLLANEVGSSPPLAETLRAKAVGLRVDFADEAVRRSPYYTALRDRFKPRGAPTVLVLQPDGTESARYTGYRKGTAEGWVQRLGRDLDHAAEAWQTRKRELGKSGFRIWTDRTGRTFFGKALRREGDEVLMVDVFRHRYRVRLDRFTNENVADLLDALPDPPATSR